MFYFCPRQRQRQRQHRSSKAPFEAPLVYENDGYLYPNSFETMANVPISPPPPYQMVENNYIPAPQQPAFYQGHPASQQYLPPTQPKTLRKKRSALASTSNLIAQQPQQQWVQQQGWQSTTNLPVNNRVDDVGVCPVARGMNQGAAFCDRVASRLNDVLGRLDNENVREEEIEALTQGLSIEDDVVEEVDISQRSIQRKRPEEQPKNGLINFRKTWLYANSRLPPQMLPFKVYMPTWQLLCRAADASMAVYGRPQSNEKEEYVDADWRHGTKAMALKSVSLDEKNLIVFAIRGSKWNLVDWAVNFRPAPTEPLGFLDDSGNACHAGFLQVARAMIHPVAARLRELLEQDPSRAGSSLLITGHSAGGAVANLLFMHMLSTRVESELNILTGCFRRVHCITFGAPPVSLLPLSKPGGKKNEKNIFMSFVNEGDPVVRADKQYIYSLGRLIAAPAPNTSVAPHDGLRQKLSRQQLKNNDQNRSRSSVRPPTWPVPPATLSNAGRLVLLRKKPHRRQAIEAVSVSDQQLRDAIFGDPSMHEMTLYKRRVDELAIAAVTGRDEG